MNCAPVLIPTLNRVDHLDRCIQSLKKNDLARFTTLIISVDYPPNETYTSGYMHMREYLTNPIDGFASVDIIYQKENLGAFGDGCNADWLKNYASKKWDRYIFTEDDNEFDPFFLRYINEGLSLYEDDNDIKFICAECQVDNSINDDVIKKCDFSAYGYGTWFSKESELNKMITRDSFIQMAKDYLFIYSLCRENTFLLYSLQDIILKRGLFNGEIGALPIIDCTYKLFFNYYSLYSVFTTRSCLVRNWGYDGTGLNCKDNGVDVNSVTFWNNAIYFPEIINCSNPIYKRKANYLRVACVFIRLFIWRLFDGK